MFYVLCNLYNVLCMELNMYSFILNNNCTNIQEILYNKYIKIIQINNHKRNKRNKTTLPQNESFPGMNNILQSGKTRKWY